MRLSPERAQPAAACLALVLVSALGSCGRETQSPKTQAAPTVCARGVLQKTQLSALLSAPLNGQRDIPGDAQSCEFTTAGFSGITISVRPGLGGTTVEAWATGKMPLKVRDLDGIGDKAVWQDTLHELIAQQHNLLCDIQVRGSAAEIAVPAEKLPEAVGSLCNRIFAVY